MGNTLFKSTTSNYMEPTKEEKIYPHFTVDSFDLIICVALIGGFSTGNWIPAILACTFGWYAALHKM